MLKVNTPARQASTRSLWEAYRKATERHLLYAISTNHTVLLATRHR